MAIGAAAIIGGALAGFSGGLGYGTGLQYSYSRGFPAFQAGGMQGMYDTLRDDIEPIYGILGSALGGKKATPVSGVNVGGQTYQQWQAGQAKPDLRKPKTTQMPVNVTGTTAHIKKAATGLSASGKASLRSQLAKAETSLAKLKAVRSSTAALVRRRPSNANYRSNLSKLNTKINNLDRTVKNLRSALGY